MGSIQALKCRFEIALIAPNFQGENRVEGQCGVIMEVCEVDVGGGDMVCLGVRVLGGGVAYVRKP